MSDPGGRVAVWPTEGVTYLAFSEFVGLPYEADTAAFMSDVVTGIADLVHRYDGVLLGGETREFLPPPDCRIVPKAEHDVLMTALENAAVEPVGWVRDHLGYVIAAASWEAISRAMAAYLPICEGDR